MDVPYCNETLSSLPKRKFGWNPGPFAQDHSLPYQHPSHKTTAEQSETQKTKQTKASNPPKTEERKKDEFTS